MNNNIIFMQLIKYFSSLPCDSPNAIQWPLVHPPDFTYLPSSNAVTPMRASRGSLSRLLLEIGSGPTEMSLGHLAGTRVEGSEASMTQASGPLRVFQ